MFKEDYYKILKQNIEQDKWDEFLEEIITEITPKGNWKYTGVIRKIFIKEKWWNRLFIMVKENVSLKNIEDNEQYLSKDYAPELVQLYRERLLKYVDKYIGRKHYQKACRYLRRMKKLGGNEEVNDLIAYFKTTYPRRSALLDELSRV